MQTVLSERDQNWLRILRETPPNTWLAFNEEETQVMGQGPTPAAALEVAKRNGCGDPILFLTPPDWRPLVLTPCE